MNRRLFPLALSLALLAGCAPAPEPTPEPTPTPAAAVDFHTFLDAVNEKRRAVIEDGEPLDVSAWTPAFADQNTTFTDGEMELLLTPHGPEENLTMEQAREDVETAFTLLRTTYGAYEYFGGDQVFDGLREDALARLEERGKLKAVITQNIDGLHQMAGSREVLELHGSVHRNYCTRCGQFYDLDYVVKSDGVPHCSCGGVIKPDVVLYEEGLDDRTLQKSVDYIRHADILIIGGTSLVVYPAAGLIDYYRGHKLVLINKAATSRDSQADLVISDPIGEVLGTVVD